VIQARVLIHWVIDKVRERSLPAALMEGGSEIGILILRIIEACPGLNNNSYSPFCAAKPVQGLPNRDIVLVSIVECR